MIDDTVSTILLSVLLVSFVVLFLIYVVFRFLVSSRLKYDESIYTERLSKPIERRIVFDKKSANERVGSSKEDTGNGVNEEHEEVEAQVEAEKDNKNKEKKKVKRMTELEMLKMTTTPSRKKSKNSKSDTSESNEEDTSRSVSKVKKTTERKKVRSKSPARRKQKSDEINKDSGAVVGNEDRFNADDDEGDDVDEAAVVEQIKNTKIIVTGGCGLIGSETVRILVGRGYSVTSFDIVEPEPHRYVDGATYVLLDIVESPIETLVAELQGAQAVCHCAGLVILADDAILHHNVTVYGTSRLLWAAREAGVLAFIHASTLTVIHDGSKNYNVVRPDAPYISIDNAPPYCKSNVIAEQIVLSASRPNPELFRTCSLRFPTIYGWKDNLGASLNLEQKFPFFPSCGDVRIEMLYVRNAAHSFYCAVNALMDKNQWVYATGKAHNITQSVNGETCPMIDFWKKARNATGVQRPYVLLPMSLTYITAAFLDFIYFLADGHVPFKKSIFWCLTRWLVSIVSHDFTFGGQTEAYLSIGYRPLFTNEASFEDIAEIDREAEEEALHDLKTTSKSNGFFNLFDEAKSQTISRIGKPRSPLLDIDWTPRPFRNDGGFITYFFCSFFGPGMSLQESILFAFSVIFSLIYAEVHRRPEWTWFQALFSYGFAIFNISGSVQTMMPTSKRWFHLGGHLSDPLFGIMMLDAVVQCLLLSFLFNDDNINEKFPKPVSNRVHFLIASLLILVPGLLSVRYCPLVIQRPFGVCYFVAVASFITSFPGVSIPIIPGLEYAIIIIAFKFFVSHCPR